MASWRERKEEEEEKKGKEKDGHLNRPVVDLSQGEGEREERREGKFEPEKEPGKQREFLLPRSVLASVRFFPLVLLVSKRREKREEEGGKGKITW